VWLAFILALWLISPSGLILQAQGLSHCPCQCKVGSCPRLGNRPARPSVRLCAASPPPLVPHLIAPPCRPQDQRSNHFPLSPDSQRPAFEAHAEPEVSSQHIDRPATRTPPHAVAMAVRATCDPPLFKTGYILISPSCLHLTVLRYAAVASFLISTLFIFPIYLRLVPQSN
jgi:hypothetical protein